MLNAIIYTLRDGTYSVGYPTEEALQHLTIEQIAVKDAPEGFQAFSLCAADNLPPHVLAPYERDATNNSIFAQLADIDKKKVRAMTDALLTGDTTRLAQLEQQAALLRPHIVRSS